MGNAKFEPSGYSIVNWVVWFWETAQYDIAQLGAIVEWVKGTCWDCLNRESGICHGPWSFSGVSVTASHPACDGEFDKR